MDTLTHLFDWLVSATVRGSLLTLAVLLVQVMLRGRVSARWLYALWLPVLIVLLMPAFPESSLSASSIFESAQAPKPMSPILAPQLPLPAGDSMAPSPEVTQPINWQRVMMFTWLTGVAGVFLMGTLSLAWTLHQIKHTRLPLEDARLNELDRLAREIGLRRSPQVWMASSIRGPAVTGFLRPTLLLPASFDESLTPQEASLVLKHELTHIKRGDLPLNALLCLLLALHWFNPLLWLAFYKARLDREAACDAQVLESESQAQRIAYGHTLLKVETVFSHHGLSLGFVGIFQRGAALRSRIQSIAHQPRPHPLMKTAASLSIVLLTFLGITKAETPDVNAPQIHIQAKFIEISDKNSEPLPEPLDVAKKVPGVVCTLTDPELQILIRYLSQRKGVDLLAAPSVTTQSGQKAIIEVAREYDYTNEEGKQLTQNLGVMLEMLPNVNTGGELELDLSPKIVELEGTVKDKNGHERPVFKERKAKVSSTLKPGMTVVVELESKTDKQLVQEANLLGRITSSKTVLTTRRSLLFVTASLVKPTSEKAATKSPIQTQLERITFPSIHFSEATVEEAVEFFRVKCRDLDTVTKDPKRKGVNFILQKGAAASTTKINLQVKNASLLEALKQVVNLADLQFKVSNFAVVIGPVSEKASESAPKTEPSPKTVSAPEALAQKIVFPNVVFDEATLEDAVEFIRLQSGRLDPDQKGLNIIIKPGGDPNAKLSLSLLEVPASEVLRFCAELAGHQVSVEETAFILTPIKAP